MKADRPIALRIQARVIDMVNVPMRVLLGMPFGTPLGGRLRLVFLAGRKTGKTYRQPLSYVRDGATLLTPGVGQWRLNLVDGHPVRIRLRGHDVVVRPELLSDIDEIERLLALMTAANPTVAAVVGIPKRSDGRLDRTRLQVAVEHGFRIVRRLLDGPLPRSTKSREDER